MLDGGRMLFVFIELIRGGRRISPEKEALVHLMGFVLLMATVVVVTYFDIVRLVA
jgi:regulator of sigma E protease